MAGDVGVDFGGLAALVPQQLQNVAYTSFLIQKMRGKPVPNGGRRHLLMLASFPANYKHTFF